LQRRALLVRWTIAEPGDARLHPCCGVRCVETNQGLGVGQDLRDMLGRGHHRASIGEFESPNTVILSWTGLGSRADVSVSMSMSTGEP